MLNQVTLNMTLQQTIKDEEKQIQKLIYTIKSVPEELDALHKDPSSKGSVVNTKGGNSVVENPESQDSRGGLKGEVAAQTKHEMIRAAGNIKMEALLRQGGNVKAEALM